MPTFASMDIAEGFAATRTTEYRRTETIGIPVPVYHLSPRNPLPPPPPPRKKRRRFCCLLCICFLFFLITFCIAYALVWAIVQPKLPEFQINSVSVPLINTTTSDILPTWEITFRVRNPNKHMKLSYENLGVLLFYDGDYSNYYFCETQLMPFHQGTKNGTDLQAIFSYVRNSSVSDMRGVISQGVANLNVDIFGVIKPTPNPWIRHLKLKIECEDVMVGFINSTGLGSLLGGPKFCKTEMVFARQIT